MVVEVCAPGLLPIHLMFAYTKGLQSFGVPSCWHYAVNGTNLHSPSIFFRVVTFNCLLISISLAEHANIRIHPVYSADNYAKAELHGEAWSRWVGKPGAPSLFALLFGYLVSGIPTPRFCLTHLAVWALSPPGVIVYHCCL